MIRLITEPQNHRKYKKTLKRMNRNLMNKVDTSGSLSCKRFEKGRFGNFHLTSDCTLRHRKYKKTLKHMNRNLMNKVDTSC